MSDKKSGGGFGGILGGFADLVESLASLRKRGSGCLEPERSISNKGERT